MGSNDRVDDIAKGRNKACSQHSLLDLMATSSLPSTLYRVYLAVYAAANALNDIEMCSPQKGLLAKGACPDLNTLEPWQLMNYLQNVNFTDVEGHWVFFDDKGGMKNRFKIVQWQPAGEFDDEIIFEEVGYYNDKGLTMDDSRIVWNNYQNQVGVYFRISLGRDKNKWGK